MKIRIGFNGSFGGLLYSSGYSYDPDCVYINGTGRDYYEFYIQLNRCGTLGKNSRQEDARKNPAVSTIVAFSPSRPFFGRVARAGTEFSRTINITRRRSFASETSVVVTGNSIPLKSGERVISPAR